jgi:hypothetical protein
VWQIGGLCLEAGVQVVMFCSLPEMETTALACPDNVESSM